MFICFVKCYLHLPIQLMHSSLRITKKQLYCHIIITIISFIIFVLGSIFGFIFTPWILFGCLFFITTFIYPLIRPLKSYLHNCIPKSLLICHILLIIATIVTFVGSFFIQSHRNVTLILSIVGVCTSVVSFIMLLIHIIRGIVWLHTYKPNTSKSHHTVNHRPNSV